MIVAHRLVQRYAESALWNCLTTRVTCFEPLSDCLVVLPTQPLWVFLCVFPSVLVYATSRPATRLACKGCLRIGIKVATSVIVGCSDKQIS